MMSKGIGLSGTRLYEGVITNDMYDYQMQAAGASSIDELRQMNMTQLKAVWTHTRNTYEYESSL